MAEKTVPKKEKTEDVHTYKLYPVRTADIIVTWDKEGDRKKLEEYLNKNAERFVTEFGILRARIVDTTAKRKKVDEKAKLEMEIISAIREGNPKKAVELIEKEEEFQRRILKKGENSDFPQRTREFPHSH